MMNRRIGFKGVKAYRMIQRLLSLLSLSLLVLPVLAQTNFNGTFTMTDQPDTDRFVTGFLGTGRVGTLGTALLSMNMNQQLADDQNSGVGQAAAGLTISFNRLDTIVINTAGIPDPTQASISVTGRIGTGTGAYANIGNPAPSGPAVTLTLARTSTSPLRYNLSVTGNAVLGGQTITLAITNVPFTQSNTRVSVFGTSTGNGTVTPFGNAQFDITVTPGGGPTFGTAHHIEVSGTISFSQADTLQFFFTFQGDSPAPNQPFTITGGTGTYAGATGTGNVLSITGSGQTYTVTLSGSVNKAGPTTPVITAVGTAYYGRMRIAPNAWVSIQGSHLVPATTPAGGMYWSNAPEFAQGKMPTQLDGISVTFNGTPGYVWWFCSAATTPACAMDQINLLTPLNMNAAGDQQVLVVVKNGSDSSAPFPVLKNDVSPSVLTFDTMGNATATHLNGSLLGPTTLYPGLSTPGKAGETVTLWTAGFGLPTTTLVEGSATQRGSLPSTPACTLEGLPAQVAAALVSPGLYQLNVTIPGNTPAGSNHFYCTFANTVAPGVLIAVQ
jgi:uncharacterized protein (TIGR03437 family)